MRSFGAYPHIYHGRIKIKQETVLSPLRMQSSSFQDLAAMRPSMLVIRNPKFANIGLCPGNSQVLMIYGILEMAPAVMEAKNAQLLPLANQKITQIITNTAMKLSKPDQ